MANPANTTAYDGNDGRKWVDVTEAKTLALADSGYVQNVIVDGLTITLPATATQGRWVIRCGGDPATGTPDGSASDGSCGITIASNSSDRIQGGPTGTATDNDAFVLAKADSMIGDFMDIQNTGETNGPVVLGWKGDWTRDAA